MSLIFLIVTLQSFILPSMMSLRAKEMISPPINTGRVVVRIGMVKIGVWVIWRKIMTSMLPLVLLQIK